MNSLDDDLDTLSAVMYIVEQLRIEPRLDNKLSCHGLFCINCPFLNPSTEHCTRVWNPTLFRSDVESLIKKYNLRDPDIRIKLQDLYPEYLV